MDHAGKVLIDKPSMEFHQPYEISVNPAQYFDESDAAMQRLSVDVANRSSVPFSKILKPSNKAT